MNVIDMPPAAQKTLPAVHSWSVNVSGGATLHLPASLQCMSTFVLMEQERWFEPEMSLLPHLLQPGMHALDIGANHGVYTLEMARMAGDGHVWAFEPTHTPRTRLLRSVQANGVEKKVTVVASGLSDAVGEASFSVHENSELNSREGNIHDGQEGTQRETVHLDTLDNFIAKHGIRDTIGFIKLDAEGEELRVLGGAKKFFAEQSPVVMFELKHGFDVNTALIAAWLDMGYAMFRWSAELGLLLPFDVQTDELACALNLVAIRPAQQAELAARGLLATADDLLRAELPALNPDSLVIWCTQPALVGSCTAHSAQDLFEQVVAAGGERYAKALNAVASAHAQDTLRPAERVRLMRWARETLVADANASAASAQAFGPQAVALVVHVMNVLGQQGAAVAMAAQMLSCWPLSGDDEQMPFVVPPQLRDLSRSRGTSISSWLRQMLGEFVLTRASFSSYFKASDPRLLGQLLLHPDHSAEVERRYLLAHVRNNQSAPLDAIRLLPQAQHTCNPQLWQSLMSVMQPLAA